MCADPVMSEPLSAEQGSGQEHGENEPQVDILSIPLYRIMLLIVYQLQLENKPEARKPWTDRPDIARGNNHIGDQNLHLTLETCYQHAHVAETTG